MKIAWLIFLLFSATYAQWTLLANKTITPNYTELGIFSLDAYPGGRFLHLMAPDKDPNCFWVGFGQFTDSYAFNDMWKYNRTNGQWAWLAGNNTIFDTAYDVNGSTVMPPPRSGVNFWVDSDSNIWIYGGQLGSVISSKMFLKDLWVFNTTSYTWKLIFGGYTDNVPITKGYCVYDTIGVQSSTARPAGRSLAVTWTASNGDLYMFGGGGYTLFEYSGGFANDIWSYNKTTMLWTFWGGSNTTTAQDQNANYGTKGIPSPLNWPVGRSGAASWFLNDTLYVFGGQVTALVVVSDVWTLKDHVWTWIGGSEIDFISVEGAVHVDLGHWSYNSTAGGRAGLMHWNINDTLFIFGGFGSSVSLVSLNDIWAYDPKQDIWAWLGPESSSIYSTSTYHIANSGLIPRARDAMGFIQLKDKVIMHAGGDIISQEVYSDMWLLDTDSLTILPPIEPVPSSSSDKQELSKSSSNSGKIAAAVVVPILVVGLIAGAITAYYFRQKRNFHKNVGKMQNEIDMETAKETNNRMTLTQHGTMLESVEIKSLIGSGNFGEVFSGTWHNTPVALKKLKPEYFDILKKEADTLLKLRHPQIVQYLGIYKDKSNQHFIVTELMNCGDLQKMLQSGLEITDKDLLQMAVDAASGMAYIHAKNLVHRDCSLRNLLTSRVTNGERKYTTKISDFGMASFVSETYYQSQNRVLPYKWASIEVLKFGKYSSASDVWAFGVTLWELFSLGVQPFTGKTNSEASDAVLAGKRLNKPERCPNSVYEMMLRCWQEKTKDRPSMVEVYEALKSLQETSTGAINNNNAKPEEFYTLPQSEEEQVLYHL